MEQVRLISIVNVQVATASTVNRALLLKSALIQGINQQSLITPSILLGSIIEAAE